MIYVWRLRTLCRWIELSSTLVCWIELSSEFPVKVLCSFQSKLDSQDERNRIESNDEKYNSCGFQVCVI